jgi:hypothetical protein
MEKSGQITEIIQELRDVLQHVNGLLEIQTNRFEQVMNEIERVKDAQNEILAGLALYERGRRLKQELGLAEKPSKSKKSPWEGIEAYCRNCTRMVPIVEPRANMSEDHTTVQAKCKTCGTMVIRTLL